MRSGIIAKKLGMSRVFTDAGDHVPVTVLQVESCQVVAHRDPGKERLHRAPARRRQGQGEERVEGRARPLRCRPCRAEDGLAEFRVEEDKMIPVGAEITADHFAVGQYVDVAGGDDRQGIRRRR